MTDISGPSWVDYGNLAANVFQVGQLSGVQKRLKQLEQIEVARDERLRLENELRQFVFELQEGIGRLSEYRATAPLGLATTTLMIEGLLDELGVQPATFQQFVDKDRVRVFLQDLAKLRETSMRELSESDRDDTVRFTSLLPHRGGLGNLIDALEAKEQLEETESRWQELESERKASRRNLRPAIFLFGFFTVSLCCVAPSAAGSNNGAAVLALIVALAAGGGGLALLKQSSNITPAYRELRDLRVDLRSKLIKHEKFVELREFFGEGLEIEEYKAIDREIEDFLSRAVEKDQDGNPLPKSLFRIALPASILAQ